MSKLNDVHELVKATAGHITSSPRDWMGYLDTAAKLYRYPFLDTLLIHAQCPEATACASMEIWNKKMNRWVNRGAKGIALIDNTGSRQRLRYVFDISDTHMAEGGRTPYLWKVAEPQQEALLEYLAETYEIEGIRSYYIDQTLKAIVEKAARKNVEDIILYLKPYIVGTRLEEMKLDTLRHEFYYLLTDSANYILAARCGLDTRKDEVEELLTSIEEFHNLYVLSVLGGAIHKLVEPILMDIGRTVCKMNLEESQKKLAKRQSIGYNYFNTLKRESEILEGGIQNGTDISSEGRLPVSESDDRGTGSDDREVWDAAPDFPEGEPERIVRGNAAGRRPEQASAGDRKGSHRTDGSIDGGTAPEIPGTGQGNGPDGMGSAYERADGDGGGERPAGIGVQLSEETSEQDLSEAEEKQASALFLPDLPTVEQQKREIEERVQALYAGELAMPTDVVDEVLRSGSNRDGCQLRMIYNFMIEQTPEESNQTCDYAVIDMAYYRDDGWLFFDTAYFEFNLMLHNLKRESLENWLFCVQQVAKESWNEVDFKDSKVIHAITEEEKAWIGRKVTDRFHYLDQLRQARILARVLAGLNYAGKREIPEENRFRAYLYACCYLKRLLEVEGINYISPSMCVWV